MSSKVAAVSFATKTFGRTTLILQKYSPEILTTVGVVGVVTSGVLASRATLRLEETVDKFQANVEDNNTRRHDDPSYSDKQFKRDMTRTYIKGTTDIAKLYGPSVTLGVASIACLVGAHGVMRKRNVALAAAYKTMEESYSQYRKRVAEEVGEEQEQDIRMGLREEEVTGEDGKRKVVTHVDPSTYSAYVRFFDETNQNWQKSPEYNHMFIKSQQNYANDLLRSRGHLFLNEVYDLLGCERSTAGSIVGWAITDKDGVGDNFVDFGMYDPRNVKAREFVNGIEDSFILDFNVNGVIYDLIDKNARK